MKRWRDRTAASTQQDVPDTPPEQWVSSLGEETLEFHEPDEDLKLEDVIPDLELPTPEEEAEAQELRWCVGAALAGMPTEWRRAPLLRHVDGRTGAELARALGRSEAESESLLQLARHYLRQRRIEAGCVVGGSDKRAPHG